MKHQIKLRHLTVACVIGLAGCAPDRGEPDEHVAQGGLTFEAFEAQAYREPETGIYIVDGDTPIEGVERLMAFYEQHVQQGALIVDNAWGVDDKWSDAQKMSLTYCVTKAFGGHYAEVVQAIEEAANSWELAAKVHFIHKSGQDASCSSSNASVLFDVSPTSDQPYLARAFFPSYSRPSRNILVDAAAFGDIAPRTLTGILRHELGHVLGFRHEHTRTEAGTCYEDSNFRPLTTYDSASVMHYPQCNGTNQGDLVLTVKDMVGAAALYGTDAQSFKSSNVPGHYIRHESGFGAITTVSTELDKVEASFTLVPGLSDPACKSFLSVDKPGFYLRHKADGRVKLDAYMDDSLYKGDATFCLSPGLANPAYASFESKNLPGSYLRHLGGELWIGFGSGEPFLSDATFRVVASVQEP